MKGQISNDNEQSQSSKEYESLNFPIIPEKSNFISQDKPINHISLADKIVSVFDIQLPEKRIKHLRKGKEKIWKVVKNIKTLKMYNEDKYKTRKYILDPEDSNIRFLIDGFIVSLILFDLLLSPFEYFIYQNPYYKNYRELIFDILFFIEIIINFFTGYYDKTTNQLVTQPKLIAFNYLKRGLVFDLIYTFPFWALYTPLMILRLVKLYRYPYIISIIQRVIITLSSFCLSNFKIKKIIIEFVSFGFIVLYFLHIFSCVYVYIAKANEKNNWITSHDLDMNAILEVYISSVYMLTQTFSTTGYGDLCPVNNTEILFMIVSKVVCCGLFSYLITCILIILTDHVDTLSFKYQTTIDLYKWMFKYSSHRPKANRMAHMTSTPWDKVLKYFNLHYGTRTNLSWINRFPFVKELKPCDKSSLLNQTFKCIIDTFADFFSGMSLNCRYEIILRLKTHIQTGEYAFIKEGDTIKRLYLIAKGSIIMSKDKEIICQLKEGDTFGLLGFFNTPCSYTYETYHCSETDYVHLYSIDLSEVYKILLYDEISFRCVINKAIEAKIALDVMKERSNNESRVINKQINSVEESIDEISHIPLYDNNSPHVELTDEIIEKEKASINVEEIIKDDGLAIALIKGRDKERELIELEMRLNLINSQILFLEKHFELKE